MAGRRIAEDTPARARPLSSPLPIRMLRSAATGGTVRILIVEDDAETAAYIARGLEEAGHVVDRAADGQDGLFLATGGGHDVMVVDRMLPKLDGLSLVRAVRAAGIATPVIFLTARTGVGDRVQGLEAGGDDYLAKPFDTGELLARCKALVRRGQEHPAPVLRVGDLRVDTRSHEVHRGERLIELPALEYRMVEYLAFRPGALVTKTELLEHLYDYNWEKFSNVIEHYAWSIRSKLEARGEPRLLPTVRGAGYRLSEEPAP